MKKFIALLSLVFILGLLAQAQCISVDCDSNGFQFDYGSTPPTMDSFSITNGSGTYALSVDSIVGNIIYTNHGGLACTDSFYTMSYWNGGSSVGTPCNVGGLLPVEMMSFTVERFGDVVEFRWVTASEYDCDYFTVIRMAEYPLEFNIAGTNANSITEYSYDDLYSGEAVYLLSQTDYDGNTVLIGTAAVPAVDMSVPEFLFKGNEIGMEDENGKLSIYKHKEKIEKRYIIK